MSKIKQFFYSLYQRATEIAFLSVPTGAMGYGLRQILDEGDQRVAMDEIIRPPLTYALYQLNAYGCKKLGVTNTRWPYLLTLGMTAFWEFSEYMPYFKPILELSFLNPTFKGTVEDISMDVLMLSLISLKGYVTAKRASKLINPSSE